MEKFTAGQRWISETEPELGLGTLTVVENRRVSVNFYASDCLRQYSIGSAPIKRVRFGVGEVVRSRDNKEFSIEFVEEENGILIYCAKDVRLPEYDLSDTLSFTTPMERLTNGLVDTNRVFNLRKQALRFRADVAGSAIRGFAGGRVDLIGHQFHVAGEIASRHIPRVLLADEVGLGKTIEACLVLHRLILSERISRVLIIVPESLVHQWFVELLRRFNLVFRIFDEEYFRENGNCDPGNNPFFSDQWGICSMAFLVGNESRKKLALEASWDMVVIDEAHHLSEGSQEYKLVESLGRNIRGLMLLTATPEQPGERSHFAHLHLLDPDRYHDFDKFQEEGHKYSKTAVKIEKLLEEKKGCTNSNEKDSCQRKIDDLLDQHGPGRVIFRNTRSYIKGFPERKPYIHMLQCKACEISGLNMEYTCDMEGDFDSQHDYTDDPRIIWLADFITGSGNEKILLIATSVTKTEAIEKALMARVNVKAALFNEKMTLLQRDRNAAWFAENNGARILICSEIGSEGRNFQFAHNLVMFDLPVNPELIEQRIGRLDRVGRRGNINIHLLNVPGTAQEIVMNWQSQGLNLFEKSRGGLFHAFRKFGPRVLELVARSARGDDIPGRDVKHLMAETKNYMTELLQEFETGRDKLLELNSFRPEKAEKLILEIELADENFHIDSFMQDIFSHYRVDAEETDHKRIFSLHFDPSLSEPDFPMPVLRKNGLTVTFDRQVALSREDIEFLTWDHPMVSGSMELLLGTEQGNSCVAILEDGGPAQFIVEAIYVLECVAPAGLHMDRFLPAVPVRTVVNHMFEDLSRTTSEDSFEKSLKDCTPPRLAEISRISANLLPEIMKKSIRIAEKLSEKIIESGIDRIRASLEKEIRRLKMLKRVNCGIQDREIEFAEAEMQSLTEHIKGARLRLDAIRIIIRE